MSTEERKNDWGHSLRDIGIREAAGKYIIHLNADNTLYEHCLAILYAYSLRPAVKISRRNADPAIESSDFSINPSVLIYATKMMGKVSVAAADSAVRLRGHENEHQVILSGWPPRRNRIDAMQLVATKKIWEQIGGWYDKSQESDGIIFEKICKDYGYLVVPEVLGEHW
jgi:hypothetical protein